MLQPQASVNNATHVWVDTLSAVPVEVGKGQVENIAGADEMRGIAFDELVAATGD